jgi:hypothetical protein
MAGGASCPSPILTSDFNKAGLVQLDPPKGYSSAFGIFSASGLTVLGSAFFW